MSLKEKLLMVEGFWTHPDFTLEMAYYAFNWALQWEAPHINLIEHAASGNYQDYRLYAIWWLDVSTLWKAEPRFPFAIPGGFTEFHFRSFVPVDEQYLVTWTVKAQGHDSLFPCGTIVYVRG